MVSAEGGDLYCLLISLLLAEAEAVFLSLPLPLIHTLGLKCENDDSTKNILTLLCCQRLLVSTLRSTLVTDHWMCLVLQHPGYQHWLCMAVEFQAYLL